MSSSTARNAPSPAGATGTSLVPASGFGRLDEVLQQADAFGLIRIACQVDLFAPVMRHVHRRARQVARRSFLIGAGHTVDAWRQAARRLGVDVRADTSPVTVARAICDAASGGVLIIGEHQSTGWGAMVRQELIALTQASPRQLLLVLLSAAHDGERRTAHDGERRTIGAPRKTDNTSKGGVQQSDAVMIRLEMGELTGDDLRRWWSAVVFQDTFLQQPTLSQLSSLDAWWQSTRTRPLDERAQPKISRKASTLQKMLCAAGQALSAAQVERLATASTVQELLATDLAERDSRGSLVATGAGSGSLSNSASRDLIAALVETDGDGWSLMRAAELSAAMGDVDRAEELALRAVSEIGDTAAREDLWRRWERVLEGLSDIDEEAPTDDDEAGDEQEECLRRLVRAAEHALSLGDGDRADRMAREAMRLGGDRFDVLLLHGRTSHARGDVTTAALSLTRAMSVSVTAAERARGAGLMAQVRFMAGDPRQAEKYADEAIENAEDVSTRLDGRNVLGKLLLAKEKWREAEQHFASDAYDAALAGFREEELRARLNRGIAVLYLGRREQAREMLEEVLNDGERHGVLRAVAFTLSNLATIAILEHRYKRALELSERAIEVRRRIGGRIGLVQPITNLAELRLRLGLVDEAEQSLRFGLHACGQGLPLSRYAFFAKLSACIHLERGETAQAAKELATAISGASCSGDKAQLAQCHRIACRIALEDGDIARARSALASADELRHTAFGQAELEVIRGEVMRAAGEPFLDIGRRALVLAQQADDPESLREAHALLCSGYRLEGDDDAAASHLRSARAAVSRIADSLPTALSQRYLRRPAMLDLDLLDDEEPPPLTTRTGSVPPAHRDAEPAMSAPTGRRLVGDSAPMRSLRGTIRRVAGTDATVLITGETGTGKELVAEAIHRASGRANGPLVKVNCAALVETLLLSELFGHEKGAFTGASARRRGRFEVAEGGTLFLDEIGELSLAVQVKLLRVLEEDAVVRLGTNTPTPVDVRIVTATNKELEEEIRASRFRQDLFYRLNVVRLQLPPLRGRSDDVRLLAAHFARLHAERNGKPVPGLTGAATDALSAYPWPGNVRELENTIERAVVLDRDGVLDVDDLPSPIASSDAEARSVTIQLGTPLEEIERIVIQETLRMTKGDKRLAAQLLGIATRTIYRKI